MRFQADRGGELVMATKRKRPRALARGRDEKLMLRDYTMRLLRDRHGYLLQDLADTFGLTRRRVEQCLASMDAAMAAAS